MKRYLSLLALPLLLQTALIGAEEPKDEKPPEAMKDRFVPLFQPFRTDRAAMSPDGKYLAYSYREGENLSVVVIPIDNPGTATAKVTVASDSTSTPLLTNTNEKAPALIRWMRWVSPTRIVVETNQSFPSQGDSGWVATTGAVFAFDFDGKNSKLIVQPKDVGEIKAPKSFGPKSSFTDQQIVTPDQDPNAVASANGNPATDPFSPNDSDPDNEPMAVSASSPRSLRVFDLAPNDPNSILIRTAGLQKYDVYKIDINSGKQHELISESVPPEDTPLVDRQGKSRVVIAATMQTAFPHRYELAKQSITGRFTNLDKVMGFTGPGFSLSPDNFIGERAIPLGFDEDPNILYYASNIGRNTYGIYSYDIKAGKRGPLQIENPTFDLVEASLQEFPNAHSLVYDRFTRKLEGIRFESRFRSTIWLTPELIAAQKQLEATFQSKSVDILEWDQAYKRLLVLVHSPADAGAYYIFNRETSKLAEFVRRAPWLDAKESQPSTDFAFENPKGGGIISGYVTLPVAVRIQPIPVVVLCANDPWERTRSDYNAEIHALADMGVAVVQFNGRGTWGFGVQQREAAKSGYEQAQVEDISSILDFLFQKYKFLSPKHVGIIGEERGGFLALRALQINPSLFRCAIAINPTVDLVEWIKDARWTSGSAGPALIKSFFGDPDKLNERPLQKHPETIKKPVCIFSYPGPQEQSSSLAYREARDLASSVRTKDNPAEFYDLDDDYARGLPKSRSHLFSQIEDFLNTYMYAYKVDIKEATPLKE